MATKQPKERAVIVTTEHRGVFFGYATATDGDQIELKRSRLCVYWSAAMKGFMGLASMGPDKGDGSGYGYGYGYGYWPAVLKQYRQPAGATLVFWRSDKDGRPSNGGHTTQARVGLIEELPGGPSICVYVGLFKSGPASQRSSEAVWP